MKAILIISHGSQSPKTKREIERLVSAIRRRARADIVHFAFLELEQPDIPTGIDECIGRGADKVLVLLNFLNSGKHVDEDIPRIIEEAKKRHPGVNFRVTKPLVLQEEMEDVFLNIIKKTSL